MTELEVQRSIERVEHGESGRNEGAASGLGGVDE